MKKLVNHFALENATHHDLIDLAQDLAERLREIAEATQRTANALQAVARTQEPQLRITTYANKGHVYYRLTTSTNGTHTHTHIGRHVPEWLAKLAGPVPKMPPSAS